MSNFLEPDSKKAAQLLGLIDSLERRNLRRFLKLDLEFKHFINNSRSSWAFRFFGGYGYAYGNRGNSREENLPLIKAYFGGGPYSMRAWGIRKLGLGSSFQYDTLNLDANGDTVVIGRGTDAGRLQA